MEITFGNLVWIHKRNPTRATKAMITFSLFPYYNVITDSQQVLVWKVPLNTSSPTCFFTFKRDTILLYTTNGSTWLWSNPWFWTCFLSRFLADLQVLPWSLRLQLRLSPNLLYCPQTHSAQPLCCWTWFSSWHIFSQVINWRTSNL